MGLSDNIWWTRKARIQTEKRLLSSAFQSQLLMLWYSFCSVAAAIYYLKFNTESEYAGVAWVVFSVLVLCVSGFINGLSHKERAALVKDSYEALHGLYQKAKSEIEEQNTIADEYEKVLTVCENHADIDYHMALCDTYLSNPSENLDRKPTRYIWWLITFYYTKKFLMLGGLYLLPVFLFFMMECSSVSQG